MGAALMAWLVHLTHVATPVRTVTRHYDIHQRPGESAEHLARRVVDECRRVDVWTKP